MRIRNTVRIHCIRVCRGARCANGAIRKWRGVHAQVLRLYKRKFCPGGYEKRHLVRLVQDKTRDQGCDERHDKWCYPLAQIEGLPDDWREQKMGPVLAPP